MRMGCCIFLTLMVYGAPLQANQTVDAMNALLLKKPVKTSFIAFPDHNKASNLWELQQHYRLLFIYSASCPHCQRTAPIVRDFTRHFNIKVEAFSSDGTALAGFSGRPLSPELFQTLFTNAGIKPMLPALFLINHETAQVYPLLFGEATSYQLALRMDELLQHIEEQFDASV